MGVKTIGTSSELTKDEIKAESREDLNTQIGVTVAGQSALDAVEAGLATTDANLASTDANLAQTQSDLDAAEASLAASQDDITANAADISNIFSQIGDPLPEELVDTLQFQIASDITVGNVSLWRNTTMTNWIHLLDDDSQPGIGEDGIFGTINVARLDLGDYDSGHLLYGWYKDTNGDGIWYQILPPPELSDGADVPGLIVKASDTKGPVWALDGLVMVGNAYTITPPVDVGSGLAAAETYDILVDGAVSKSKFITTSGFVTIPADGEVHEVQAVARDESLNSSVSNTVQVTLAADTGGQVDMPADAITVTEGDNVDVILSRTGGSGAIEVKIYTLAWTAIAGTNFTAISPASPRTVSWGAGDFADKTETILTSSIPSTVDVQFFVLIEYGSGDASNATVGRESVSVILTAAGSSVVPGWLMADTSPFWCPVEAESYDAIRPSVRSGDETDQFTESSTNTRVSSYPLDLVNGGVTLDASSGTIYGDDVPAELDADAPYYTIIFSIPAAAVAAAVGNIFDLFCRCIESASTGSARDIHPTVLRPIKDIGAADSGNGGVGFTLIELEENHGYSNGDYVFIEGSTNHDNADNGGLNYTDAYDVSSVSGVYFDVPNSAFSAAHPQQSITTPSIDVVCFVDSTSLTYRKAVGADTVTRFKWTEGDLTKGQVMIPAAGSWHIRFYMQDVTFRSDKWLLCPHEASPTVVADLLIGQPSSNGGDDPFGPVQVLQATGGGGSEGPHEDNTDKLPVALPADEYIVPADDRYPPDGAVNQTTTTTIRLVFPGMTNIIVNYFVVLNASQEAIDGTYVVYTGSVEFTPASPLNTFAEYSPLIEGRVTLSDGITVESIDATGWTFTTINPTDPATTLFYLNFEGIRP